MNPLTPGSKDSNNSTPQGNTSSGDNLATATLDNVPLYQIGELQNLIRNNFRQQFAHFRIQGEVVSVNDHHSSGHLFFEIREDNASISCVCWRGRRNHLGLEIRRGMEILLEGSLTASRRSSMTIAVKKASLVGLGALLQRIEKRRRLLAQEGLFDSHRKRPLPYLPRTIGVITSPTGAVLSDMWQRMVARFGCTMVLWPVSVQGDRAVGEIVAAMHGFHAWASSGNLYRPRFQGSPEPTAAPDVIVIARGGGGPEELLPFSEEPLLRAVAKSTIPVVSAIGHASDHPLLDDVADRYAATPTAAMVILLPDRQELSNNLRQVSNQLHHRITQYHSQRQQRITAIWTQRHPLLVERHFRHRWQRWQQAYHRLWDAPRRRYRQMSQALLHTQERWQRCQESWQRQRIDQLNRTVERKNRMAARYAQQWSRQEIPHLSWHAMLAPRNQRIASQQQALHTGLSRVIQRMNQRQQRSCDLLHSLGYTSTLRRGYVLALDSHNAIIRRVSQAQTCRRFRLRFSDGDAWVTIEKPNEKPNEK